MGKKAPKADPNIGRAAMKSAETGEKYLAFMQKQSDVTNGWATEDRNRYQTVYQPIEDAYIAKANAYGTPEQKDAASAEAIGDVRQQAELSRDASQRRLTAMGVNPASGRFGAEDTRAGTAEALAAAGAGNMARRGVEAKAEGMQANVINMGKGLAVNPATSMGLANGAASSGFSGAMQGYGQQGNLLNTQYQQQMQSWQANQNMLGSLGSAIGTVAMMSSKDAKTDKKQVFGILDAVKEMPVEKWTYKEGMGDGKTHVGTYAEDFKEKTGLGNGREISIIDALGVNMGAIKELAAEVDALKEGEKAKPKKQMEAA